MEKTLLRELFEEAWFKGSCYNPWQSQYINKPKSYGQCVVTSLYIHALLGGTIVKDLSLNHYWNILPDGSTLDLTVDQFESLGSYIPQVHKTVSCKSLLNNFNTRKRFQLLINRINALNLNEKYGISEPEWLVHYPQLTLNWGRYNILE